MQWIVFKWSLMKCSFLSAENFLLMSLTGGCLAFEISLWSFFKLLMFLSSFPVFMCTFHIQENFIFPCVFPISMWISCFHEHIPFSGIIPVSMSVSCFHVYFLTTVLPLAKSDCLSGFAKTNCFLLEQDFYPHLFQTKGPRLET